MTKGTHLRWALPMLGLGFFALSATRPSQGKSVSLGGTWTLDAEKTASEQDEAAEPKTREGFNSGGGRVKVGTGATEPRSSGRDRSGGPPSGGAGEARASLGPVLGAYARPLPKLVIEQTDSTITISDPLGGPRTYRLDGRKEREALLGADSLEVVARMKGGKLTTERKFGQLGNVRETYSVDGDRLLVEVRITAAQLTEPLNRRRVYMRAGGTG